MYEGSPKKELSFMKDSPKKECPNQKPKNQKKENPRKKEPKNNGEAAVKKNEDPNFQNQKNRRHSSKSQQGINLGTFQ